MRNRRTSETSKDSIMAQQAYSRYDLDDDEYGAVTLFLYYVKLIVAFCVMILTTILWTVVLLLLIPWPYERIKLGNMWGRVTGRLLAAREVVKNKLSLIIFPEGTRSRTGRLLPFKKGVVHLAVQTRLPIVPVVMIGTHSAWKKGGLCIRPVPMAVKFLPPVKTDDWTLDKIDEHVEFLHDLYVQHLPKSQKPLASDKLQ